MYIHLYKYIKEGASSCPELVRYIKVFQVFKLYQVLSNDLSYLLHKLVVRYTLDLS